MKIEEQAEEEKEKKVKLKDQVETELRKKGIAKRYNHENKTYTTQFNHLVSRFNIPWLQNPAFQVSYLGVKGSPEAVTYGTNNIYVNPCLQPQQAAKALYKEFLHIDVAPFRVAAIVAAGSAAYLIAEKVGLATTPATILGLATAIATTTPFKKFLPSLKGTSLVYRASRFLTNDIANSVFTQ